MKNPQVAAIALYLPQVSAVGAMLAAIGAFAYGILLLMTVSHAAASQSAQAQIRELTAQVAQLESQYLAQTQAITPSTVTELGFVQPKHVSTVYAQSDTGVLSMRSAQ